MNHQSKPWTVKPVRIVATAATLVVLAGPAAAQTIEYTVTDIPLVPDAYITFPLAINNHGVVVGWAMFTGGGLSVRAWRWSADSGLTLLPPPPGAMSDYYLAVDLNDAGVIAGDGGYDSGQIWRFEDNNYTIIGTLPRLDGSRGPAMNIHGDIVGTSFDSQTFLTPTRALLYTDEQGLVELFPEYQSSSAGDMNDVGQIAAGGGSSVIRVEPDGSRTFLPQPPGFARFGAGRINAGGDIAGIASCSHECNQAALWTETGGYQIIPWMGTRHSLGGLNDRREVVGGVEEGVARGWVWSPQQGLRTLAAVIDPGLTRNIYEATGINNRGQIIAYGQDYVAREDRVMLLTPVYWLSVENLVSGQTAAFTLTGATANANQYLVYSLRGPGSTFVGQLNVTLDLARPVLLTSGRADANGAFETTVHVPRAASGRTVWFQGAEMNRTTPAFREVVQ